PGAPLADEDKIGSDWTDEEQDLIVADYFAMLADEQAGRPYVKSHHAAALMDRIGRTHRSVEFKHMNISAVLEEIGHPRIRGYKPKENYQRSILDAIERHLVSRPVLWTPEADQPQLAESTMPFLVPPPLLRAPRVKLPELERFVRKFDPAERDFRNRELGKAGEQTVFDFERQRLLSEERPDLASKVRWVAQEDGDGAGYDIKSFDQSGGERLIEVKTTTGSQTTPFFLTRNEYAFAEERVDAFKLMRLYAFGRKRCSQATALMGAA
ncbi:MAG: DUF3883 domain-containing protein, partial [Allosphingosinicella sp.]